MLCRLLASTPQIAGIAVFLWSGKNCELLDGLRMPCPVGFWVLPIGGAFWNRNTETKMRHETIHRCSKCGIVPVYQTARLTEPRDDVPSAIFRLQCPICGRYGAYCTTKQAATQCWNREPFIPPRERKQWHQINWWDLRHWCSSLFTFTTWQSLPNFNP